MDELEIMRVQLEEMKQRLNTQQIVNKDLMKKIMRGKASWLNQLVTAEIILLPLLYLIFVWMSYVTGVSQWYPAVFLVIGSIDTFMDLYSVRIPPRLFGTASIIELKIFLLKQRKFRFIQTCAGVPAGLVWGLFFLLDIFRKGNPECASEAVIYAALVIAVLVAVPSILIVIWIYRKIQRTGDALLHDIHELESNG